MSRRFSTLLEDCLQRLDRGESLADVLAHYPEREDELKQLLLVAMASRAMPIPLPSQTALRLGRNQMLAEMNRLEIKEAFRKRSSIPLPNRVMAGLVSLTRTWGLNRLAHSYRWATVLVVLAISGGFFTLNASASSAPGDLLYNLKLSLERAGLVAVNQEEFPDPVPLQYEVDKRSGWNGIVDVLEIQDGGSDILASFLENEEGSLIIDPDLSPVEKISETDKEEEKDLKDAEKEAEKDLKDAEKEAEKDLKEEEKDLKDTEKEAEKNLKDEDKILKKIDK
jgi:hypothetical protein